MQYIREFQLQEWITRKDLDKLRSDFGAFSKNIRRVRSLEELLEVYRGFRRWIDYFYQEVFVNFLGKGTADDTFDLGSMAVRNLIEEFEKLRQTNFLYVRRKTWDNKFFNTVEDLKLGHIHPALMYSYMEESAAEATFMEDSRYRKGFWSNHLNIVDDLKKAWWAFWEYERDYYYQRIGKLGRSIFEAIDTLFETRAYLDGGNAAPERQRHERHMIGGVNIDLYYSEGSKFADQDREKNVLLGAKTAIEAIQKKGFGAVLKGMHVELNPAHGDSVHRVNQVTNKKGDIGGLYWHDADDILVITSDDPSLAADTFAHEAGHRFYYQLLPKPERDRWDEFFSADIVSLFDEFDRIGIRSAISKTIKGEYDTFNKALLREAPKVVDKLFSSQNTSAFHAFVEVGFTPQLNIAVKDYQSGKLKVVAKTVKYLTDIYMDNATIPGGQLAPREYSKSNPSEMFADVFAYYVLGKPLDEAVFTMFVDVTGVRR